MLARRLLVLTLFIGLAASTPARASTTIGDISGTVSNAIASQDVLDQTVDGTGPSYAVPAGGGVITAMSTVAYAYGASTMTPIVHLFVVKPGVSQNVSVVGGVDVLSTADNYAVVSGATRIPVSGGERLGEYATLGAAIAFAYNGVSGAIAEAKMSAAPADGATFDVGTAIKGRLALSATLEPDADHDGYGDETQDSCPDNVTIHAGPCLTDLQAGAVATPSSILLDGASTVIASVTNAGHGPAQSVGATLVVPAGLQVLSASTSDGTCDGNSCALGDIPAGATRKVFLVVSGASVGMQTVTVVSHSVTGDPIAANDAAAATITVAASPAAATVPLSAPAGVKLCTVPSLKGKTAAAAKTALAAAGCAAGAAKGAKSKTAKVTTQTIPSKVVVVAGTRVGFTLKAAAKKSKKTK